MSRPAPLAHAASTRSGRRAPWVLVEVDGVAETGVDGRIRTAVLERPVVEALDAAVHGADLVLVGARGKRLLRPALPRQPLRRVVRGA